MSFNSKKNIKLFSIILVILTIIFFITYIAYEFKKKNYETKLLKPISINLITNTHPDLPWTFKAIKSKVNASPGKVLSIEYQVENLGDMESTGIATFAYYPPSFGKYISKLNCFCYDAQSLGPKEKMSYTVVLLVDPMVTKDSKTKNVKEVTIQFTFFDYKKYKKIKKEK